MNTTADKGDQDLLASMNLPNTKVYKGGDHTEEEP